MSISSDNDPWALPGIFYSVLVKRAAVARSYPGGVEAFERREQPIKKNGALFLLVSMDADGVDRHLLRLWEAGIVPGEDVAVGDMRQGPLLECPGIAFSSDGELLFPTWAVNVDPAYNPPGAAADRWQPPEPKAPPVTAIPAAQLPEQARKLTANQYYQLRGLQSYEDGELD